MSIADGSPIDSMFDNFTTKGTQLMAIYSQDYIPYFYIIQDVRNGMYYAGSKYAQDANPSNFMIEGGYETSSETIKELIRQYGLDNFIVRKIRTFKTGPEAYRYEKRFLEKVDARKNERFYNKHNNDFNAYGSHEYIKFMIEKYGVENPMHSEKIKEKLRNIHLEKRDVEYPGQCEEVKKKAKITKKEKYGDENYVNVEKARKTKQERYGDPGYTNKEKAMSTNSVRYGGNAPASSPEVVNKMKRTSMERYGAENYNQSDEGRRVNVQVKKDKKNREIVSLILQMTTKKQRGEKGLGRGWYQRSDEYLQEVYSKIINQW